MEEIKFETSYKTQVQIIPQTYLMQDGQTIGRNWAVLINGIPKYVFYSESEVNAFLRGLQ